MGVDTVDGEKGGKDCGKEDREGGCCKNEIEEGGREIGEERSYLTDYVEEGEEKGQQEEKGGES